MNNTFKCYCEGDIERVAKALKEMVEGQVKGEVTIKCPNVHWPEMILTVVEEEFRPLGEVEESFVDIVFDLDVQPEIPQDYLDMQEKIEDMSDEELSDFINDLLDDLGLDDEDEDDDPAEGAD